MGNCASTPIEPFDYEGYFNRVKQNLQLSFIGQQMPFLLINTPRILTSSVNNGPKQFFCYADGPLPDDVMTEFKFVPVEGKGLAKADLYDCSSTALLLTALVERHGWTLLSSSMGGSNRPYQLFTLQKPATGA